MSAEQEDNCNRWCVKRLNEGWRMERRSGGEGAVIKATSARLVVDGKLSERSTTVNHRQTEKRTPAKK